MSFFILWFVSLGIYSIYPCQISQGLLQYTAFCCCLVVISWLAGRLDIFVKLLLIYSRFLLRPEGEPHLSLLEDLTDPGLKAETQESTEGPGSQRRA